MFEYSPQKLTEIKDILKTHNANGALIKKLPKNDNDKQQVYSGTDFQPLYPYFRFEFDERVQSISAKKGGKHLGTPIMEAKFKKFLWLAPNAIEVPAKNLKMIIYPQYPESRLSGFEPITATAHGCVTPEDKNN